MTNVGPRQAPKFRPEQYLQARDVKDYKAAVRRHDWAAAMSYLGNGMRDERWPNPSVAFLLRYADAIPEDRYGGLLWSAYKSAFQGLEHFSLDELRSLFRRRGTTRAMGGDDHELLRSLPERVTVYRGFHEAASRLRMSWSLSRSRAAWFALLFHATGGDQPTLIEGHTAKEHILLCFVHEWEVIVDPTDVIVTDEYPVPADLWEECGYTDEYAAWRARHEG